MFTTLKERETIENFIQTASESVCNDDLYSALKRAIEIMEEHDGAHVTKRGRYSDKSSRFWVKYNSNPLRRRVGDCAIRACCKATGRSWEEVYWDLSNIAFDMADGCNSSNAVWGEYLKENGYVRYEPDYPMDVYKFCCNFPRGTYVLCLDEHVVTVVDGFYYDTWDSGGKNVIYFWEKN